MHVETKTYVYVLVSAFKAPFQNVYFITYFRRVVCPLKLSELHRMEWVEPVDMHIITLRHIHCTN